MKNIAGIVTLIITGCSALALCMYRYPSRVSVYAGDYFHIPSACKNLALLGCTPHPTEYLKKYDQTYSQLTTITLSDFVDIEYVRDSFRRTFVLCKKQKVDHLLIAYLPIYYAKMRVLLADHFVQGCSLFFQRIVPDIVSMTKETSSEVGYNGGITLILPTVHHLTQVPREAINPDDRIRYLIKQFPRLHTISKSSLETITIINNKESPEDDTLIDYLKYEYLFERPIRYNKCAIGKDRFHSA